MQYHKVGLLLMLLLLRFGAEAQTLQLDKLKRLLPATSGAEEMDCMNRISQAYYTINTDSAFFYTSEAYKKSRTSNYVKGMSDGLHNLGQILQERGDINSAEKYFRDAVAVSEKKFPSDEWARDILSLGYCFLLQGRFPEAKNLTQRSLDYYLQTRNESMQDYTFRVMSTIYASQGYYEKAFSYLQKAFAIGRNMTDTIGSHSSTFMWNTYLLGELYKDAGDDQTALEYYNLSLMRAKDNRSFDDYYKILGEMSVMRNKFDSALYYYGQHIIYLKKRIPDPVISAHFLIEPSIKIGEIYLALKNYEKALSYFTPALPFIMKSDNNGLTLKTLSDISKAYIGQKQWETAFQYARQVLAKAKATGTRQYIRDGVELYWKIFDAQGKTESAYRYYLQYTSIRDSIARDVQLRNIAVNQMKVWGEKQESKIQLLQKEKKIQEQQSQFLLYSLVALIVIVLIVFWNVILKRRNAVNRSRHLEDIVKLQTLESEKIKMEFQHRTAALEMQALRAQMNPHFIFNSLNAINRFILQNDRDQASAYLTKFSRLVRMILHHSQVNLISLESELESLQLYLELEALRFDNHFRYVIKVDPLLDTAELQVAPLIIQPYTENAIWHGLMHKEEEGLLVVDIFSVGDLLYCRITDDGIGRTKAASLKSKSVSVHKSMGMRITGDRIARMGEQNGSENSVSINDIILPDGSAGGTEVILKIPVIYA